MFVLGRSLEGELVVQPSQRSALRCREGANKLQVVKVSTVLVLIVLSGAQCTRRPIQTASKIILFLVSSTLSQRYDDDMTSFTSLFTDSLLDFHRFPAGAHTGRTRTDYSNKSKICIYSTLKIISRGEKASCICGFSFFIILPLPLLANPQVFIYLLMAALPSYYLLYQLVWMLYKQV